MYVYIWYREIYIFGCTDFLSYTYKHKHNYICTHKICSSTLAHIMYGVLIGSVCVQSSYTAQAEIMEESQPDHPIFDLRLKASR